jgi:paraquat-inducible protein B
MKQTLQELAAAARSLRALADALERNPESLLVGKPGAPPKR